MLLWPSSVPKPPGCGHMEGWVWVREEEWEEEVREGTQHGAGRSKKGTDKA